MNTIYRFIDLETWQVSHQIVLKIYSITKTFPKEEIFGLISQIRRSAVSVTSNIAEGFGRNSYKDKVHFYYQARGSLMEVKNQLILSRDIGYISNEQFEIIDKDIDCSQRLLNGLIAKTKSNYL